MLNDTIAVTGKLEIILHDSMGNIKDQRVVPNLVVTVGKTVIASRLAGVSTSVMTHMSVGTTSTAPIAANTTLLAEIVGSRVALTVPGGTPVTNVVTYTATFGPGVGTGPIVEAGIFNDPTVGSMLCRTAFSVVNKDIGDSLTINWAVTIA